VGEEERVVGVEQWAEIRRMHRVERRSIREIHRVTGFHRATIRRALVSDDPPRYRRVSGASKLDPLKPWIEEQLRADPGIPSKRLRELAEELGYEGGQTIFDDHVREVRPRFLRRLTYQRTLYRPGELLQFDLFEPREPISVGHGQTRRGFIVTAELGWSRALAGALVFSKQAPDLLWGMSRCLRRFGALPERLVWDREGAIHAGGGRPSEEFAGFCGQLAVGWLILDAGDAEAKGLLERSHRFMRTNFEPGRRFANHLDYQAQLAVRSRGREPDVQPRLRPLRPRLDDRHLEQALLRLGLDLRRRGRRRRDDRPARPPRRDPRPQGRQLPATRQGPRAGTRRDRLTTRPAPLRPTGSAPQREHSLAGPLFNRRPWSTFQPALTTAGAVFGSRHQATLLLASIERLLAILIQFFSSATAC
jgi:hypothetical protein